MRDCLHRQAPDQVGRDGRWCAGMSVGMSVRMCVGMCCRDVRRMEPPINQFVMDYCLVALGQSNICNLLIIRRFH